MYIQTKIKESLRHLRLVKYCRFGYDKNGGVCGKYTTEVTMFKKLRGDSLFYRTIFLIAFPMIIQNGITNFVSLLDNIMVGQVGTIPMSGVSIVNNLIFVFNLCIFGAVSGAGIFTAQFFGNSDHANVRNTFRFKFLICLLLSVLGIGVFLLGEDFLIGMYLRGEGNPADAAQALAFGRSYLHIMLWGVVPFAITNAYSSTLRETGQTVVPMLGGVAAVVINLILNYVLIFGHFGAPELGVEGAAIATVISRYAELLIVALWTHLNKAKNPFIHQAYRSMHIPKKLFRGIFLKGMPLLVNEFFWATGMAFLNQCYSTCGLDVVPAMNISSTIYNLLNVAYLAMGNAVGILMGQMLGAGSTREEILDSSKKYNALCIASGIAFALIAIGISGIFPKAYNTTPEVRTLATQLIIVTAVFTMTFNSYSSAAYFTLRSGGQALITFIFDSGFLWFLTVPLAVIFSRVVPLSILPLYLLCQATEILKCVLGKYFLRKGKWINRLTE